jgi:hypothetical protein
MAKKILYLDKEAFVDWFFDEDIIETFVHDQGVMKELKETGKFTLKIEELLSGCGYLSDGVVSEGQEVVLNDMDEVDMNHYDKIKFK